MPEPIKSSSAPFDSRNGNGSAFLVHGQKLYLAAPDGPALPGESPVTRLIRGIWALEPAQALLLLRNRILTDLPLTPACEGMIKVAAKRSTVLSQDELRNRLGTHPGAILPVPSPTPGRFTTRELPSAIPTALLESLKSLSKSPKPVSAVLLSPDGMPLLGAWSANEIDRTAHAELNLVRAWFAEHRAPAPAGSTLQVSLRPCAMCAAQILALSGEPGRVRVVFHEEDPGPLSKNSCLVPGSDLWHRAGKPDWEARPYFPSE